MTAALIALEHDRARRLHWLSLISDSTPHTRGRREGVVIGLALALDQLQSDTNRTDDGKRIAGATLPAETIVSQTQQREGTR